MTTTPTEISRLSTITASERAMEINASTKAWVEAEEGRWAGYLVEDPTFWSKMEVESGLDLERSLLASTISDTYKECHGFRPRFYDFESMTLSEMEEALDRLQPTPADIAAREAREAEEARWAAEEARLDARDAAEAEEDAWWAVQDQLEGFRA